MVEVGYKKKSVPWCLRGLGLGASKAADGPGSARSRGWWEGVNGFRWGVGWRCMPHLSPTPAQERSPNLVPGLHSLGLRGPAAGSQRDWPLAV